MTSRLVQPHGGRLVDLMAKGTRAAELKDASRGWPSWTLTQRQMCDLELLLVGAFSPLEGFMCRGDYENVCRDMRLEDGTLWPIPIELDVSDDLAPHLSVGSRLALRDPEGFMLGALRVEDIWEADLAEEARLVYGTTSVEHPAVARLSGRNHRFYLGGRVEGIRLPRHYDFIEHRLTPLQVRERFHALGWHRVAAFQTRNPMHRVHVELTLRAVRDIHASLLIHPAVGETKPGDVDHFTRVRCYRKILERYPPHTAMLCLLPLAMRMAGPREALWHALIRQNYGCSHFIVGRDHAGPGRDSNGDLFYGPYEAQRLLEEHGGSMGIEIAAFEHMVYVEGLDRYMPEPEVRGGQEAKYISGSELRRRLEDGRRIPEWFTYPEVAEELRRTYRPRCEQGLTVLFTGLPGAGKSTLANVLRVKLLEMGGRQVTLLDGDIVRRNLSSELGFSRSDRNTNIRRIGFVAGEITKSGGVAICAPIAPYGNVRRELREDIREVGGFVLVHVATPLEVCEERDPKGLYAKARDGMIEDFTGVSDPYEEPEDAEVRVDTAEASPEECVQEVILFLQREGYIGPGA